MWKITFIEIPSHERVHYMRTAFKTEQEAKKEIIRLEAKHAKKEYTGERKRYDFRSEGFLLTPISET